MGAMGLEHYFLELSLLLALTIQKPIPSFSDKDMGTPFSMTGSFYAIHRYYMHYYCGLLRLAPKEGANYSTPRRSTHGAKSKCGGTVDDDLCCIECDKLPFSENGGIPLEPFFLSPSLIGSPKPHRSIHKHASTLVLNFFMLREVAV